MSCCSVDLSLAPQTQEDQHRPPGFSLVVVKNRPSEFLSPSSQGLIIAPQTQNRQQQPQAPVPLTTAAKPRPSKLSQGPEDPLTLYERTVTEEEKIGKTKHFFQMDIKSLPAEVEQNRKNHAVLENAATLERKQDIGKRERKEDAIQSTKVKDQRRIIPRVDEKEKRVNIASKHSPSSRFSSSEIQNFGSETDSFQSRKRTLELDLSGFKQTVKVNSTRENKSYTGKTDLHKISSAVKRVPCSAKKSDASMNCYKPEKRWQTKFPVLPHQLSSQYIKNKESPSSSASDGSCAFIHELISIPDPPFRDPLHEPPITLICASTLKVVARSNTTEIPPVRVSSSCLI